MADLIVIDRNIFEVPITTVHQTKVLMTIIDGEIVPQQDGAEGAAVDRMRRGDPQSAQTPLGV